MHQDNQCQVRAHVYSSVSLLTVPALAKVLFQLSAGSSRQKTKDPTPFQAEGN